MVDTSVCWTVEVKKKYAKTKRVKFWKFSKVTAKPNGHGRREKVMEKVMVSHGIWRTQKSTNPDGVWELITWSLNGKFFDLLSILLTDFVKEKYGDRFGKFVVYIGT